MSTEKAKDKPMADSPKFDALDKTSSVPIWAQLRDRIIEMIRTGALEYGQKMPTVRNLAKELGVSVSVVNQAYRYLKAGGYLEARQGSAVRVRERRDNLDDANFPLVSKLTDDYVNGCMKLGLQPDEILDTLRFYLAHRQYVEESGEVYWSEYLNNLMGPAPSFNNE